MFVVLVCSYADTLTSKNTLLEPRTREGFLKYYRNFLLARTAMDDWNDDDGPGFVAYQECEGNQMLSWKGKGYITVLKLLMVIGSCEYSGHVRLITPTSLSLFLVSTANPSRHLPVPEHRGANHFEHGSE